MTAPDPTAGEPCPECRHPLHGSFCSLLACRCLAFLPAVAADETDARPRGWWVISGESFIAALRRAHEGENPEMLYAEWYANSDLEEPTDE